VARKRVGILIFPEVEVLDFCGPFEVFSITRLNEEKRREEPSPFDVVLVAQTLDPVEAAGGLRVLPQYTFDTCPKLDILVAPGGYGTRLQVRNEALIGWIGRAASQAELVTSVCTGSLLLAKAGLLDGVRATTHWRVLGEMRSFFPQVEVVDDEHVVEQGRILTSAGVSAGIDMALRVVKRCFGETIARAAARQMEYPYSESNERRITIE